MLYIRYFPVKKKQEKGKGSLEIKTPGNLQLHHGTIAHCLASWEVMLVSQIKLGFRGEQERDC